jgi:hypothetical protein
VRKLCFDTSEKLFLDCPSDPRLRRDKLREESIRRFEKKSKILRLATKNVGILRMTRLGDFSEPPFYKFTRRKFVISV